MKVTVLGGGSWGTTVASLAASNGPATLWARSEETAREVREQHTNGRYLGDRVLPARLQATSDLAEAVGDCDVLVMGIPSTQMRDVTRRVAPLVRPWVPVLSLSKGLEPDSRKRMTQVLAEELPGHPIGLMAGPNLAKEVLDGFAAAAVVATADRDVAKALQPLFTTERFRVYRNQDVLGSELGGVLKNIIAIAIGMADGLGVGDNTRAMVITRGLAEMTRLGRAMGADAETFAGLTGLGDLMATCMSQQSRNRCVGEGMGKGETIEEVLAGMSQVAEGVRTARPVVELAAEFGVVMPIAHEVDACVNEGRGAREAYRGLRRSTAESENHAIA